jgi:hypothetical protein
MTDTPIRLLAFINRVRGVQELAPLPWLVMLGTDPGDERGCILAQAMECAIGGSTDPDWAAEGRWVLRFSDRWTARTVAIVTGQPWRPVRLEVELPQELVDFAVSFSVGEVEQDDIGFLRAWRVPADVDNPAAGMWRFVMPGMEDVDAERLEA